MLYGVCIDLTNFTELLSMIGQTGDTDTQRLGLVGTSSRNKEPNPLIEFFFFKERERERETHTGNKGKFPAASVHLFRQ